LSGCENFISKWCELVFNALCYFDVMKRA